MIVKFSRDIINKHPELFRYIEDSYPLKIVTWVLDSRYRKAVSLVPWLEEQVRNPSAEVKSALEELKERLRQDDHDWNAVQVLRYVYQHITYVTDKEQWQALDYWMTAAEVLRKKKGDCEDGMTLSYVLCRLAGIPSNRLYCFCGDVQDPRNEERTLGHAVLMYRPTEYPLNIVFLDWCYFYESGIIERRNLYTIQGTTVYGFTQDNKHDNRYKKLWFCFNEQKSFLSMRYHLWK